MQYVCTSIEFDYLEIEMDDRSSKNREFFKRVIAAATEIAKEMKLEFKHSVLYGEKVRWVWRDVKKRVGEGSVE